MDVERATEIIAAYGGDPARWPAGERDAATALVGANEGLAQARRDAAALDAALLDWAQHDDGQPALADARAAAMRILAARAGSRAVSRSVWRWTVGTGMAAAIAAGVLLTNPFAAPPPPRVAHSAASDAAAFAMIFTPTPDEDGSI